MDLGLQMVSGGRMEWMEWMGERGEGGGREVPARRGAEGRPHRLSLSPTRRRPRHLSLNCPPRSPSASHTGRPRDRAAVRGRPLLPAGEAFFFLVRMRLSHPNPPRPPSTQPPPFLAPPLSPYPHQVLSEHFPGTTLVPDIRCLEALPEVRWWGGGREEEREKTRPQKNESAHRRSHEFQCPLSTHTLTHATHTHTQNTARASTWSPPASLASTCRGRGCARACLGGRRGWCVLFFGGASSFFFRSVDLATRPFL